MPTDRLRTYKNRAKSSLILEPGPRTFRLHGKKTSAVFKTSCSVNTAEFRFEIFPLRPQSRSIAISLGILKYVVKQIVSRFSFLCFSCTQTFLWLDTQSIPARKGYVTPVYFSLWLSIGRGVATCTQIRNCVPENNNKKINK